MSQLSPSQALTVNEGIYLHPRHSDQTRYPGTTRHFDRVKLNQQHRPNVPTNPDRSCTYLFLRAHSDERSVQLKPNLELPRGGAAQDSSSDQHLDKHWPGGVKIKMTLGMRDSQGKKARRGKCKTKVGPCWKSFIQSELSSGSHKSPNRVRDAKSRNITTV